MSQRTTRVKSSRGCRNLLASGTHRQVRAVAVSCLLLCAAAWPAHAQITVAVSAPGGNVTQTVPDEGGAFRIDLPLNKNMVNEITVTASDTAGNSASQELTVTQVSLADIIITEFSSETLSPEEVEQLVDDGVIDLDDPDNFDVSIFEIIITIDNEPVPISIPIALPLDSQDPSGSETYRIPQGDGSGGGRQPSPPIEIIVFEEGVPSEPGEPAPPPIPGVFIIEGRIKSLKEFFNCRLLLLNASGIFTLSNVVAELVFPDGGLSNVLPASGVVAFGDILPGDGAQPGQVQKEFIIRGDEIGVRGVRVNFGGAVTGAGIPADGGVPFNGSVETDIEVKGPPSFAVEVFHPDRVEAGVPYDLRVDITNTGELPALYASLEIDVGADAELVDIALDEKFLKADFEPVRGPVTRALGHIFPSETVSEIFTVNPLITGVVSSCMGVSDQNIALQVYVGTLGCAAGHFPPEQGVPDGIPSVTVLPAPNAASISVESPVAAFFSKRMREDTITTGEGGTFNVYNQNGDLLPGVLRFDTLNLDTDAEKTVAIWQYQDNVSSRLPANAELTVELAQDIRGLDGNALFNPWLSTFTTTGTLLDDDDPPELALSIEPPTLPNFVLPGEIVRVNAYASDQGSGVARVEARLRDLDEPESQSRLIDQKRVILGDLPPYIFALDSAELVPGHTYRISGRAYDGMGNIRDATLSMTLAATADPPTVTLPDDPALPVLHGISVDVTPVAYTGGVRQIQFFLDGAVDPFHTATLRPYQSAAQTLGLELGPHTLRAVATDGLGQTGEDTLTFELAENLNMPTVDYGSAVDGAQYVLGTLFGVNPNIEDPVGIASTEFYLDEVKATPIATGSGPFAIDTTGLSLGTHRIVAVVTNLLGISNDPGDADSILEFNVVEPPPGVPPAAPTVTDVSLPDGGAVTVQGASVPGARIDVTNTIFGLTVSVYADPAGAFTAILEAAAGHVLELVAYDFSQSPDPSETTTVTVETPVALTRIEVAPDSIAFDAAQQTRDLTVTGHYGDGSSQDLTEQAIYSSSDASVASVNAAGRVVALGSGAATITAEAGGQQATAAVTVDIVSLTSISVDPPALQFDVPGASQQLTVTGHYSDGHTDPLTNSASFASGDPAVAAVSPSGLVTAAGEGNTAITVAVSGLAPVTVPVVVTTEDDTPPTVEILSPADGTEVERGQQVTISVQAGDTTGGVTRVDVDVTGAATYSDSHQVDPPAASTTETFVFTVPDGAPVGGAITVSAQAFDNGDNDSPVDSVQLTVVDHTAPALTIDAPANETGYNFGDTVTVEISATDAAGVTRIRYETTGALAFSGSRTISPPTTAAGATFVFQVPYAAASPDVSIHAFAYDAEGNEGVAAPVAIVLTDADITPPETEATAVADPGANTTARVNYRVLDGLADLDYVALYFRRDALGTFNRYTDADGGNPNGEFFPQNDNEGWIDFDSLKMGGDGGFEFYSVGVDQAGNREAPPDDGAKTVIPDQTATFNAGTVWTTIDASTFIASGDTTYDGKNVRITGAGTVVTMDGRHAFHNVEIMDGAMLDHPQTTLDSTFGIDFSAWTLTVHGGGAIDVTGQGYLGGRHGENTGEDRGRTLPTVENPDGLGSTSRSGGSYGGPGATYDGAANDVYGSLVDPVDLGSGGSDGSSNVPGGDGGGRMAIEAINIVCDGGILANGGNGQGNGAGSGSGGSVKFAVATVSGTGLIAANGGAFEVGGGGGRVAVYFIDIATLDRNLVQALGGVGSWSATGANGTVFFKGVDETNGTLVFDGQGTATTYSRLPIPPGFVFDNIILRNNARVLADDPIVVTDSLEIRTNSILSHTTGSEDGASIEARRVYVDPTGAIDVSGRGYPGGRATGNTSEDRGITLGGAPGASTRAGASYGGYGGVYDGSTNPPYGHPADPVYLGSGGSDGSSNVAGGHGGGRITIAANDVDVEGAIRANGSNGAGNGAGSGSGGSIKIQTGLLRGTGVIAADGGAFEVAGGGGRVAIDYEAIGAGGDDLGGLRNITALGGRGSWSAHGSAGTVLLRHSAQPHGDLYIDDNVADATAPNWTPLTRIGLGRIADLTAGTLTTDGDVPMIPNGLVGLELNPNIAQDVTFTVISNTDTTITVDTATASLTDVASVGDTYAGVYNFDNLYFRRGGWLVLGDRVHVTETISIAEYGRLDHYDATTTYEPRLDVSAGTLDIGATGAINVDGRGYLGGRHGANGGFDQGRTLDNAMGSTTRSGGSYGGLGGRDALGVPNAVYGNPSNPGELGSGGSNGSSNVPGGDGGGRVRIVTDTLIVDGLLSASGGNGQGNGAGSGSGGSINITADTISGGGHIRANGAAFEVGAGGGRIAIRYNQLNLDTNRIEVFGGQGSWGAIGGNGTLFLKGTPQSHGDLVVDGGGFTTPAGSTPIVSTVTFNNITLRSNARVVVDVPLTVTNTLHVLSDSILTHSLGHEAGLQIEAGRVHVGESAWIDASGRGYAGGRNTGNTTEDRGLTLGGHLGAQPYSGGSYGGYGAVWSGNGTNPPYGHPGEPVYLGSGGSDGSSNVSGGHGGGRITIDADEVDVAGGILANGWNGGGNGAGSGSGGSIWIRTGLLHGAGVIAAGGGSHEVAGGGGRVAIDYDALGAAGDDLDALRNITAWGGQGSWGVHGSAGTVLLRHSSQSDGDLYIDGGAADATAPNWTPLTRIGYGRIADLTADTLTVDGNVPMIPDALQGLALNPNIDQSQTFLILSNTETTITVDTTAKQPLTSVASVGDTYTGVYWFDNVYFRRGGWLVLGDQLAVEDTMAIGEYGRLDHFDATISYEPRLDLTAGVLHILETGAINITGRGYLGGRHGNNADYDEGRTLDNALGSTSRSGGSYGGLGGAYDGVANGVYGDATNPAALGSGGSDGSSNVAGGDGGGWATISVGTMTVDGRIYANGANGAGNGAGSGSGGTVHVTADALSGTGGIHADGGAFEVGGGGGRVTIFYDNGASDLSGLTLTATGGVGSWSANGQDGTVHTESP